MEKAIPIAAMERILKRTGAERVAEDVKRILRDYIEKFTEKLALRMIKAAKHGNRKTVRLNDFKFAVEENEDRIRKV